jgi:potassium uptake TrkH family protein
MAGQDQNPKYNDKIYRWFFIAGDRYRVFRQWFLGLSRFLIINSLLLFLGIYIIYIGFDYSIKVADFLATVLRILFLTVFFSKFLAGLLAFKKIRVASLIIRGSILAYTFMVFLANFAVSDSLKTFWVPFRGNSALITSMFLLGLSELSGITKIFGRIKIAPSLVFASGFLVLIFIGSGLLFLPKAHTGELTYLDSLFTAVSAVCVTGLVVVDTATTFTEMGKIIILLLIQIGGLGIMTFTGFFSYIFIASGSSFRQRLLLKEIFTADSMNSLFSMLIKIISLTFLTEIVGALIIYSSLEKHMAGRLFFSIFHSVSAFCNAGFSTLPEGLYSPLTRFNNTIHLSVALLIILGGIGFPVLVYVYAYIENLLIRFIRRLLRSRSPVTPGRKNISARLVLVTTVILIVAGTLLYYIFESRTTLSGLSEEQKLVTAFFGSVSARTAGFNITDITRWSYPTISFMILLMWIGASPGSTGGGIKTTTFAVAVRSVWSNLRGKDNLKIVNREISSQTLSRVLSIIMLSVFAIASGFFALLVTDPGKNPVNLLFECVSAFATVGLSIQNTATFSQEGKIVLVLLMYIGRVGPLTLFNGLMVQGRKEYYRYPDLEIIIN